MAQEILLATAAEIGSVAEAHQALKGPQCTPISELSKPVP